MDAQGAVKGFNDLGKAADRNLGKADQRLDQMASRFQKAGAGMLAGAGLASAGLYKAGQAAGELEQAMGGTEAVFGDASDVIDDFAKKAAQSAGLSESAFRTATTSIGGQLKGLGFSVDEAADQAVNLTQVAADLSATYGGTTAEAVAALGAAFRGEADPAERFNLFLNQTRVNAKAVELGLAATTSSVDANAKAQATLALITEQSADAQGQFARESDTAQGAMARFRAESDNLLASLGGAVAPVMAEVAGSVGGLAERFNELPAPQQAAISKFLVLSTAAVGTAGALSFTAGKILDARDNLGGLIDKLGDGEGGLSKFGKAGVIAGIALGGLAIKEIGDELSRTVVDVDRMADGLANLTAASEDQTKASILAADNFGQLDTMVSQLAEGNEAAATKFVDLAAAAGIGADQIARYRQEIADNRRVQAQSIVDQRENSDAIDETVTALGGYGDANRTAATGVDGVATAVERQKEALDMANESMDAFKQGIEDAFGDLSLEEATDRRASAFQDMADRFNDAQESVAAARQRIADIESSSADSSEAASERIADAERALAEARDRTADTDSERASRTRAIEDAERALADAIEERGRGDGGARERDLAAAQADLQAAIDETSRSLEGNSETALTNREDLRGAVDDIAKVIQAHRDEGASLEDLQAIRDIEKANLAAQLEQMGFNREEIGQYIAAIDEIPITKATVLSVDTAEAQLRLKEFLESIGLAAGQEYSADAAILDRNLQRATASAPRRAIGGPVTAGMGYSANEYLGAGKGFEWFAPANGTVHPAGSAPGGAVEQNVTVNVYNPVAEPASKSAQAMRRASRDLAA